MKVKKHKKFQRSIAYYQKNFSFKPPYFVLVDGTFAKAALDNRVNLREQLPKYLDAHVTLMTTPCALIETEKLGPELYGALQILKQLDLHKCEHGEKPCSASDCIKSVGVLCQAGKKTPKPDSKRMGTSGGKLQYIFGTQDQTLRSKLRKLPGLPLIYLYGSAPVVEKPSTVTEAYAENKTMARMEVSDYQKEILNNLKKNNALEETEIVKKGTKKRKRAGPNPLSCKKSKTKKKTHKPPAEGNIAENVLKAKRKRKRLRIASHVKAEIQHQLNTAFLE